jgi:hypothetical protein
MVHNLLSSCNLNVMYMPQQTPHIVHCIGWNHKVYLTNVAWARPFVWARSLSLVMYSNFQLSDWVKPTKTPNLWLGTTHESTTLKIKWWLKPMNHQNLQLGDCWSPPKPQIGWWLGKTLESPKLQIQWWLKPRNHQNLQLGDWLKLMNYQNLQLGDWLIELMNHQNFQLDDWGMGYKAYE